jgi:hypothetical protein
MGGTTTIGSGVGTGWGKLFTSVHSTTTVERAQRGFALATCPGGLVYECEYLTNVRFTSVDGHGVCKDNRGATYRLLF